MKITSILLFTLMLFILVPGCKKDEDNPTTPPTNTTPTSLVGSIAGPSESGRLTLEISLAKTTHTTGDTVTVSGKIYLSTGDTVVLSGILVKSTGYVQVAGTSTHGTYTLTGTLTNGKLSGSYTGPNGDGGFAAESSSNNVTVTVYCGTSQETSPGNSTGTFNLILSGTSITVVVADGPTLYGTLSGTTINIYAPGTSVLVATGTVNGNSMSGTYNSGTEQGTWTASICQ